MRCVETVTSVRRQVVVGCALIGMLAIGVVLGMGLTASKAEAQAVRGFTGDGALMFHFVKPAQTASFERVMAELDSALDVNRGNQARGWKVFRADTDITGQGNVMYVWVIDPVVGGADYAVSTILNEAVPEQVQDLYQAYNGSYTDGQLKQLRLNLDLVRNFGG